MKASWDASPASAQYRSVYSCHLALCSCDGFRDDEQRRGQLPEGLPSNSGSVGRAQWQPVRLLFPGPGHELLRHARLFQGREVPGRFEGRELHRLVCAQVHRLPSWRPSRPSLARTRLASRAKSSPPFGTFSRSAAPMLACVRMQRMEDLALAWYTGRPGERRQPADGQLDEVGPRRRTHQQGCLQGRSPHRCRRERRQSSGIAEGGGERRWHRLRSRSDLGRLHGRA